MSRYFTFPFLMACMLMLAGCESDNDDTKTPAPNVTRVQFSEKDFVKNQYFWLTAVNTSGQPGDPPELRKPVPNCRENYRDFSYGNHYALPAELRIRRAEFWIKPVDADSGTPGRAPCLESIRYWTRPWDDYPDWFGNEKGYWSKLQPDSDYTLDLLLGVVRLNYPLLESDALACAFATANDTFGTFAESADTLSLVLIKAMSPDPDYATWNLMFRHVYPLSIPVANLSRLKLIISRCAGDVQETCPPGMTISYLTYFYFDLEQTDGSSGPDGIVDDYTALIARNSGELHFLDLTPFNPSGFEDPAGTLHLWDFALLEQTSGDLEGFRAPYLYTERPSQTCSRAAKWRIFAEYQ